MKIYLQGKNGERVNLDDTDFVPPPIGFYIDSAIKRRELTREFVCEQTEISPETLEDIIAGKRRLDKEIADQLDAVFSDCSDLFLRIQNFEDYYARYGRLRPDNPIKRFFIELAGPRPGRPWEPAA
jgi:plasmid maintenance system antidote protein VapI